MPALAGTHNIIADQGATFSRGFIKKDSKRRVVPLTGYTARLLVTDISSGAEILTLTTENGRLEIDAPRGLVAASVTAADMGITAGKYEYILELIGPTPDFEVERLLMGTFTIRAR